MHPNIKSVRDITSGSYSRAWYSSVYVVESSRSLWTTRRTYNGEEISSKMFYLNTGMRSQRLVEIFDDKIPHCIYSIY